LLQDNQTDEQEIPDFTDHENWLINSTLNERYGKGAVETMQVDVELRLALSDRELTLCPAIYWEEGKCKFILAKVEEEKRTGNRKYRSQFFYRVHQHFGEEDNEYIDLGDCVVNLLKLQEKYEKKEQDNPVKIDMRGVAGNRSGLKDS
jgi:hypothetical protein